MLEIFSFFLLCPRTSSTLSPFICLGCFKQRKLSCFLWSDNFEQSSWNHCLSCLLNYVDSLWHKLYLLYSQPTMIAKFISLFSEAEIIFSFQCDTLLFSLPRLLTFWDHILSHQSLQRYLARWQTAVTFKIKVSIVRNSPKNRTSRIRECLIVWCILPKVEVS